jgi:hypothetical protein
VHNIELRTPNAPVRRSAVLRVASWTAAVALPWRGGGAPSSAVLCLAYVALGLRSPSSEGAVGLAEWAALRDRSLS